MTIRRPKARPSKLMPLHMLRTRLKKSRSKLEMQSRKVYLPILLHLQTWKKSLKLSLNPLLPASRMAIKLWTWQWSCKRLQNPNILPPRPSLLPKLTCRPLPKPPKYPSNKCFKPSNSLTNSKGKSKKPSKRNNSRKWKKSTKKWRTTWSSKRRSKRDYIKLLSRRLFNWQCRSRLRKWKSNKNTKRSN